MDEAMRERLERRAKVLRALSHSSRLLMLELMGDEGLTVSRLTELVGSDISTVSRHLSVLRDAGIVSCERDGNRRIYSLRAGCVLDFLDCVEDMLEDGSAICAADIRRRMEGSS